MFFYENQNKYRLRRNQFVWCDLLVFHTSQKLFNRISSLQATRCSVTDLVNWSLLMGLVGLKFMCLIIPIHPQHFNTRGDGVFKMSECRMCSSAVVGTITAPSKLLYQAGLVILLPVLKHRIWHDMFVSDGVGGSRTSSGGGYFHTGTRAGASEPSNALTTAELLSWVWRHCLLIKKISLGLPSSLLVIHYNPPPFLHDCLKQACFLPSLSLSLSPSLSPCLSPSLSLALSPSSGPFKSQIRP